MKLIRTAKELRAAVAAPSGANLAGTCTCAVGACAGWESVPEDRWPAAQMQQLAMLRDPECHEPTFEEYHLDGTRYESAQAPVAVAFFPYNRCDLWQCARCQRHLLRYTEFGGYYIDHRTRALDSALITN